MLQRDKPTADDITPTCNDADAVLRFFDEKVEAVRASTEGQQPSPSTSSAADATLSVLSPCSEEEVRRLIMQSNQVLRTRPHHDLLTQGNGRRAVAVLCDDQHFTAKGTTAVITQARRRHLAAKEDPTGHTEALKNYRPVSSLTFMSTLVERVDCSRLVTYLNTHGLMPQLQSAYRVITVT